MSCSGWCSQRALRLRTMMIWSSCRWWKPESLQLVTSPRDLGSPIIQGHTGAVQRAQSVRVLKKNDSHPTDQDHWGSKQAIYGLSIWDIRKIKMGCSQHILEYYVRFNEQSDGGTQETLVSSRSLAGRFLWNVELKQSAYEQHQNHGFSHRKCISGLLSKCRCETTGFSAGGEWLPCTWLDWANILMVHLACDFGKNITSRYKTTSQFLSQRFWSPKLEQFSLVHARPILVCLVGADPNWGCWSRGAMLSRVRWRSVTYVRGGIPMCHTSFWHILADFKCTQYWKKTHMLCHESYCSFC